MHARPYVRALAAALGVLTTTHTGCGPLAGPPSGVPRAPSEPPAATPPEPVGVDCLTDARVESMFAQLRRGVTPDGSPRGYRLVGAECRKRVYLMGSTRFVFWDAGDSMRGKAVSKITPPPTPTCIERGLAMARNLVPFADRILRREAAQSPDLWRDPDVGAVSYLECDAAEQPTFLSVDTMLHEGNHAVSRGKCIFDFAADRDLCFELDPKLLPGTIAEYARPPGQLDAEAARWFLHVQKLYLEDDGQGIRELFDEVMAYSVSAELFAVAAARRIYPGPSETTYNNLPLILALATRYLNELSLRDPAAAAREFGPSGRSRAAALAIFDRAEGSYRTWLQATRAPNIFERTFWDDYQQNRREWLRRTP